MFLQAFSFFSHQKSTLNKLEDFEKQKKIEKVPTLSLQAPASSFTSQQHQHRAHDRAVNLW